jgi:integrase
MTGMKVDLDYLVEELSRHGRRVIYVRRGGKRIRILEPIGTPAFYDAYRSAVAKLAPTAEPKPNSKAAAAAAAPKPRTLAWLIDRYLKESTGFATMDRIGQRRRDAILTDLRARLGAKPMAMPTDKIAAGVTARATQPGKANEWLKSVKALYAWAVDVGILKDNPAAKVRKIRVVTDGYHTWSVDEIAAYVRRHPPGSMAYLAIMTLLFTGLRRSDVTIFGRQHVRGGVIRFRTGKTKAELVTSASWPFLEALALMPATAELPFLQSARGKGFASGAAFGNWFKDRCTEAGLPHCSAHGLRKAASVLADEGGASDDQINAMFTWVNPGQSSVYTRTANRMRLADAGFSIVANRLIEEGILARKQNANVAPAQQVREGATKTGV